MEMNIEQYLLEKVFQHTRACMLGEYVKSFTSEDVYNDLVEGVSYSIAQDLLNGEISLIEYMQARNYAVKTLWALMPEEEQ